MSLDFILKFGVVALIIAFAAWITERYKKLREREINAEFKDLNATIKEAKTNNASLTLRDLLIKANKRMRSRDSLPPKE